MGRGTRKKTRGPERGLMPRTVLNSTASRSRTRSTMRRWPTSSVLMTSKLLKTSARRECSTSSATQTLKPISTKPSRRRLKRSSTLSCRESTSLQVLQTDHLLKAMQEARPTSKEPLQSQMLKTLTEAIKTVRTYEPIKLNLIDISDINHFKIK